MSIEVRFFASLRERLGKDSQQLDAHQVQNVTDVWLQCTDETMPINTLMAVNMEYVDNTHPVQEGDEVAFFPPVTGG